MRVVGSLVIVAALVGSRVAAAQPDPDAKEHATELYRSAEAAMADQRWTDAVRDYGAAYELTKDPVLFWKIADANQKAGKCEVALIYYRRYLKEGKPSDKFAAVTQERIAGCEAGLVPRASGLGPRPEPKPEPKVEPKAEPTPVVSSSPSPSSPAEARSPKPEARSNPHRAAWLSVGTAVTFATIGAVLAYAARSSEADISDLYVGIGGKIPSYNRATAQRYNDLVSEGQRYEHLSWLALGLAGASAITATILFARGGDTVSVVPAPTGASISAAFRF